MYLLFKKDTLDYSTAILRLQELIANFLPFIAFFSKVFEKRTSFSKYLRSNSRIHPHKYKNIPITRIGMFE